ncbi:MAG: retropepsin-like aspartic protease [Candidatus Omnitrophota bacterium]
MKNKRILTGVIKEESDTAVVVDIGIGKVTILKSDIESIEKAGTEEQEELVTDFKKREIEKGTFIPPGLEDIANRYQELKRDKNKVDVERSQFTSLKKEFNEKKEKFNSLLSTFNAKNQELRNLDPNRDVKYYNKVVSDVNSLNAKLALLSDDLLKLNDKYPLYSQAVQKTIIKYKDSLVSFKIYFEKESKAAKGKELTGDEVCFYDTIGEATANLEKSLRKDSIALVKSSGNLVVEVKLNDTVMCLMAVDTGASLVTISRSIASQLEIDFGGERNEIEMLLADGSKAKARMVNLKSVAVGNSRAEDILAAVMDRAPGPGIDGLLGMSFLDNFSVKIDSVNNALILETIE